MARIKIIDIGPIKEVEIDLNKVNVIMGPQSSGKSTIAKIICHCQSVEKQCYSGNKSIDDYNEKKDLFYDMLVEFHRLEGYFNATSEIEYCGEYVFIKYIHKDHAINIKLNDSEKYEYSKISYIPSERNFVSAIPNIKKYNERNDVILSFIYDWTSAREIINKMSLNEILDKEIDYSYINETDYIVDKGSKLLLSNASSGVQSLIPLYMVMLYSLNNVYSKPKPLSSEQENRRNNEILKIQEVRTRLIGQPANQQLNNAERIELNKILNLDLFQEGIALEESNQKLTEYQLEIENKFKYKYTQIFIEEPEQNLFPHAQQKFVYWLLKTFCQDTKKHSVLLTTHSPYILFALNNCMMGGLVSKNIPSNEKEEYPSFHSWINPKDVSIYEIHDGKLTSIQDSDGIIEDNYLNKAYKENSNEYLSLLNYYDDEE